MPRVRGSDEAERQDEGGNPTVDVRHVFADRGHAPTGRGTRQAARRAVVPEFLRTLVFARPRGDDQFADCTFSPSLDMSR